MYSNEEVKAAYLEATGNSERHRAAVKDTKKYDVGYPTFEDKAEASGENFGDYFRKAFDQIDSLSKGASNAR